VAASARSAAGACVGVFALAAAATPGSAAEQQVTFTSAATVGPPASLQGFLTKPKAKRAVPAVVLLHSCLGLPTDRQAIGARIASWGYAALFVDDFSTRGLKETCSVDFAEALADADGALAFLARRPEIDASRIAVVGYSQGGDTALSIATGRMAGDDALADGAKFVAAAAYYPPCANQGERELTMPILILIGEADSVTPYADCRAFLFGRNAATAEFELDVFPKAAHGFDNPGFAGDRRVLGMTLKYDAKAADQATADLRRFLRNIFGR
jgi:dienelactone hydrolase